MADIYGQTYAFAFQTAVVANGNGGTANVGGLSAVAVDVAGLGTATINFEGLTSDTNTDWTALEATNLATGTVTTTATVNGFYLVPVTGLAELRCRVSGYSSGTITVGGRGVVSPIGISPAAIANIATNLNFTSPASATTTAYTPVTGLGGFHSMSIFANIKGGTGGTLDIYIQYSPDAGTTWVDYAHFAQLADGAAAITRVWTVSKSAQQTTLQTVGTATSPALAATTIIGGDWGDRLRVVAVAGAGTSAGAAETILLALSS